MNKDIYELSKDIKIDIRKAIEVTRTNFKATTNQKEKTKWELVDKYLNKALIAIENADAWI